MYGDSWRNIRMAESRSSQLVINVEPTVHKALQLAMMAEGLTASTYIRRVLIKHLQDQGLLTTEMLAEMVTK